MSIIAIVGVENGFHVTINGTPVVKDGTGLGFDRLKGKVPKTRPNYVGPKSTEPHIFDKSEAKGIAHQIGRYIFGLGDMTFSYTNLVNVPESKDDFWENE